MITMFDFVIFCHVLRLMGIYLMGIPVRVFENFRYHFSFFFFFPFLFFIFLFFSFVSLSGAPLTLGPLDIVHPCHPVATPLHTLTSLSLTDCLMAWSFSQFTKKSHRLAVDTGNLTTSNASFGHMTHTGSYVLLIFVPCLGHTSSWHATDI